MNTATTRKSNADSPLLSDAIAALIASTRRVNRKLSLTEISEKLRTAKNLLGSLHAVATAVGLSDDMIRQFSRIDKLVPKVKSLLADRKITSIEVAQRISRLPLKDQYPVAKKVATGDLSNSDVRAILPLRKHNPGIPIDRLISQVRHSRNIKEYIVEFPLSHTSLTPSQIRKRFASLIGNSSILSLSLQSNSGKLVITEKGARLLSLLAREQRMSKRELVNMLVSTEVK